ncbi:succinoglycan biosynthesis protein [Rhizobium sp. 3T7]|uniref:succinoglycan biosynthesis protein n=1 Tax=Rhizobium sp. 3T7 TaxID=2874922 RepID=UPI001CCE1BC9|nr:succinoglycan biosynthesis protein [Rhizobium sp. 3T7]MBZ9789224.1 succinoglycan biosynthesis protein [Rhizobium sp. 3T7]
MYDSNPRSQAILRPPTARRNNIAMPSEAALMPAAEAKLLGVIERALEQQRASRATGPEAPPLVSRIETILGKRLEAANDIEAAIVETPPITPAPVARPTEAAANLNQVASATPQRAPKTGRFNRLATIGLICALGGASGSLIPAEPVRYSAEGTLAIQGVGQGRAVATKAAEKTLSASHTIAATVAALKLDRDPEFSGGSSDAFAVAADLLSTDGTAADPVSRAEASLVSAIRTATDPHAGTIDFKVTTGSAEKSARIAGYLASVLTSPEAATGVAEDGSLKKADDAAQLELASFTQKSGEGNVKVATDLQEQIESIDGELKAVEQRIVAAQEQARRLKTAKVGDVLAGTLDTDLMLPTLIDHRDRYVAAHLSLSQLSANFGPRHPRLQAQQAEVDGLKDAIGDDLGRLVREANDKMKSATVDKRQLRDHRNALIAQSKDTGVDFAKLTELRDKASAARLRLEDAITTGAVAPGTGSVQLQKPVQTVAMPAGQRWLSPLLGALAGLAFGLAVVSAKARSTLAASARKEPSLRTPAPEPNVGTPSTATPAKGPQEVDIVRAELAAMRDRLRTRSAAS